VVGDCFGQLFDTGNLLCFSENIAHYAMTSAEEDIVFFSVKDLSCGIVGIYATACAEGVLVDRHFDSGFKSARS
jgi:hypothetical protein